MRKWDDAGKEIPFECVIEQDKALNQLKEALLQNVMLVFPDMNDTFYIQTDASKHALAHCLLQEKSFKDPYVLVEEPSKDVNQNYQQLIKN